MTAYAFALQAWLVQALKAADIADGRVYDRVPEGAAMPYVSIGPSDEVSDDAECIDGAEISQQLDVWSDRPGFPEAKTIAGEIRAALHQRELVIDGFPPSEIVVRTIRYLRGGDGLTSHAAIDLRAFIERG